MVWFKRNKYYEEDLTNKLSEVVIGGGDPNLSRKELFGDE